MHVVAVNQFYAPDRAATSQMLANLCEGLASRGIDVSVVCGRGQYLGGSALPQREVISGVDVRRTWVPGLGKSNIAYRAADYASFWITGVAELSRRKRPDVLLALTTPPLIAAGCALVAAQRRIPLVTWVQDVYPDLAIHLGVLGAGNPMAAALRTVQSHSYQASRTIVALSDCMATKLIQQGAPADRIQVIENWADGRVIRCNMRDAEQFRAEHRLNDRFVVMYSGNLGLGHEFDTIIGAAHHLQHGCPRIVFVFVGDGVRRTYVERRTQGLTNVRFLPYQSYQRLGSSLAAADLQLVSLREDLAGLIVPSKLYGILASGRPVIWVGPKNCDEARLIDEQQVGWTGEPGDVEGLVRALQSACESPVWCESCGEKARQLFEQRFDLPLALERWRAVLLRAAS